LSQTYNDPLPRFDLNADGQVSSKELVQLASAPADLTLAVSFDTKNADRSKLEVTASQAGLIKESPTIRETSMTLMVGRTWLELSAVQSHGNIADQISVGAVRDGYPLLPEMDADEDGRLTVREARRVANRLKAFDRDGDGRIAKAELLPTLRLSFGHGAIVHQQLQAVRSIHAPSAAASVTPPDWFTRMDRNSDSDLTPREFLGAKEQFASLDLDRDGLISAQEASQTKDNE
jgi:Ca2+-binding EF-hand superfamily protein